jgi:predicted short-subunit dehydrogenase-like oxidoreductase (DUF2520 family)
MKEIKSVVILGSGNVATFLARTFFKKRIIIAQIYSRDVKHAEALALECGTSFTSNISEIHKNADIYIFAVSDSAISEILLNHNWTGKFLVHTAGSVDLNVFKDYTLDFGILYPLQTFTKGRNVEFENIPMCVEANSDVNTELLKGLASQMSKNVICIDSQQRAALHLAAVFANNFTNHMYSIAYDLLNKYNLPQHLLTSLIQETTQKAMELSPKQAQTGPAIRRNTEIMNKHVDMLSFCPDWQKIYTFASKSIMDHS